MVVLIIGYALPKSTGFDALREIQILKGIYFLPNVTSNSTPSNKMSFCFNLRVQNWFHTIIV